MATVASQAASGNQTDSKADTNIHSQLIDSLVRNGCASVVTSPTLFTVSGNQANIEIASDRGAWRLSVVRTLNGDEVSTEIEIERTLQGESVNGLPAPKRTKKCSFSSRFGLGETYIAQTEVNGQDSTNLLLVRCDRNTEDIVGPPVLPTAIADGNVEIRALREEIR